MKFKITPLKVFIFILALTFCNNLNAGTSALDAFLGHSNKYEDVIVKKILNTDTIQLDNDEYIYLIGLTAPEDPKREYKEVERDSYGFTIKEPVSPETPVEEQAISFARKLLEGKHVRLEFDVERRDKNSHSEAYVFLLKDNTFVNTEILRQGYATLHIQPPNLKYEDKLRDAYKEANSEKRGLQGE